MRKYRYQLKKSYCRTLLLGRSKAENTKRMQQKHKEQKLSVVLLKYNICNRQRPSKSTSIIYLQGSRQTMFSTFHLSFSKISLLVSLRIFYYSTEFRFLYFFCFLFSSLSYLLPFFSPLLPSLPSSSFISSSSLSFPPLPLLFLLPCLLLRRRRLLRLRLLLLLLLLLLHILLLLPLHSAPILFLHLLLWQVSRLSY